MVTADGPADGGRRATSFAYGRHVASVVVYVYARVFAALQTAPDRWCARVVVCVNRNLRIHTHHNIYVYRCAPDTRHPNCHHHYPLIRTAHTAITATTATEAAPPDGSTLYRVTAVVRHTATATTPTPHRACFADTTGTYDTIFVAVVVVVVVGQSSTRRQPHFVAVSYIPATGDDRGHKSLVRISPSGLRLSHCRIYRFKTVQDCESIAMLRFEACMSSSRRTKSYSCHSVDPQHVSVNSSGPVNVAIATNTVLSQSAFDRTIKSSRDLFFTIFRGITTSLANQSDMRLALAPSMSLPYNSNASNPVSVSHTVDSGNKLLRAHQLMNPMASAMGDDLSLKDLTHPALNDSLKTHNAATFKLVKTGASSEFAFESFFLFFIITISSTMTRFLRSVAQFLQQTPSLSSEHENTHTTSVIQNTRRTPPIHKSP
ncbi:hypothetical protein ACI65C_001804 [Semiaphis heraclei]